MAWKTYVTKAKGIEIAGDETVPKTRWWNHLWLLLFGWKTIVVFAPQTMRRYRVGYRDAFGKTMLCTRIMVDLRFKVRIGHEPCTFFAIDLDGNEVELRLLTRTTKDNTFYADIPML